MAKQQPSTPPDEDAKQQAAGGAETPPAVSDPGAVAVTEPDEATDPEASTPEVEMTELVMAYNADTGKASPMSRLMADMSGCEVLDDVPTHGPDGSPRDVTDRDGNPLGAEGDEPGRVLISGADQAPAVAVTASADQQKEQTP